MSRRNANWARTVVFAFAITFLLTFGGTYASADTLTSSLTNGNPGVAGFSNFGTVTVNLTDSTHATITFTANESGSNAYLFGGAQAVDVQVNASSWAISGISSTALNSTFTSGPVTNGGSNTVDGFGTFNQTFDSFDGFQHSSSVVSFTVQNTSGTWASAGNVLGNTGGFDAAAHIFVCSASAANCSATGSSATATGFASEDAGSGTITGSVPEPTSIALLGGVVLGVVRVLRKKVRRS